jgi:subtilisin family serine protease
MIYADTNGYSVAGIIGANQYGVAPHASLINVKVIDNEGKLPSNKARVAEAIRDIIAEHNKNKELAKTDPNPWNFRGSVINMSFSWVGLANAISYEVIDANDAGISLYAAAGNQAENFGDRYPCANPQVRCIAAVDNTYNKYKKSNYGSTVDFVAPGVEVREYHSGSLVRSEALANRCPINR